MAAVQQSAFASSARVEVEPWLEGRVDDFLGIRTANGAVGWDVIMGNISKGKCRRSERRRGIVCDEHSLCSSAGAGRRLDGMKHNLPNGSNSKISLPRCLFLRLSCGSTKTERNFQKRCLFLEEIPISSQ
jgi:hypothetical protein